jgi:hypothetical protein
LKVGLSKIFELDEPFKLDLLFAQLELDSKSKQVELKPDLRLASIRSSSSNVLIKLGKDLR